jgi:type II secretory pathway component GspD/PulD (secretin)
MYVTPFLVGVDTIHLVIDIEVSRLGQDFVIGTDGNNQQIIAPSLNTRKASTEVYVRNGSTVIIGGLKLIETRVSESRIPLLGDLPLLGFLFSSRSKEELDTTVTFMFTPKIKARPSIDPFGDVFDPFEEAAESE